MTSHGTSHASAWTAGRKARFSWIEKTAGGWAHCVYSKRTHPPGFVLIFRSLLRVLTVVGIDHGKVPDMGVVFPDMGVMDSRVRLCRVRLLFSFRK